MTFEYPRSRICGINPIDCSCDTIPWTTLASSLDGNMSGLLLSRISTSSICFAGIPVRGSVTPLILFTLTLPIGFERLSHGYKLVAWSLQGICGEKRAQSWEASA